jgi:protein gp37
MSDKTKIAWTDATWSPIVGCSKCSPGCDNCYAETVAASARLQQFEQYRDVIADGRWNGKTSLVGKMLDKPLHWKRPRRIFVCSMSDLFHESVPDGWRLAVFSVIKKCPQHTFQILTKRASDMHRFMSYFFPEPLPNVHLGVTVENESNLWRVDELLKTPAAKRFVSIEPMLGPVDLRTALYTHRCGMCEWVGFDGEVTEEDEDENAICPNCGQPGLGKRMDFLWNPGVAACEAERRCEKNQHCPIDWVIVGGESGPNARPMDPDWARSIRDQCAAAGVAFFMKQMSGRTKAMREAIPEDLLIREFPK